MKVRTIFPNGQSFGKLKAIAEAPMRNNQRVWECVCECGNTTTAYACHLRSGKTKSCGCGQGLTIHGQWKSRTYRIWAGMKSRCLNPRNDAYHYYGERGITVCERWRDSFTNFLEDMGHAPAGLRIERKDNDGNYEPGNCIWATHTVQMRNTRRTRKLTVRGVTGCLDELAQHFGVNGKAAWYKLRLGWTPEEALFTPVKHPRIYFTVRGINGCIAELCRHFGIQHGTALKRLERGWTPDESFCTPVQGSGFRLE